MPFDVEDAVRLLARRRAELFAHERAIRLFQFYAWMWFPSQRLAAPRTIGRLAAAILLRDIEREQIGTRANVTVARQKKLFDDQEYRQIYNQFIAPGGGWSSLITGHSTLKDADRKLEGRYKASRSIVVDLLDYRVRQLLAPNGDQAKALITHAVFFNWWPNRSTHGSPSCRTMFSWWGKLQLSSIFIYLNEKLASPLRNVQLQDKDFIERITADADDEENLARFFGAYSFLKQKLAQVDTHIRWPEVPLDLEQQPISVPPFTVNELEIIAAHRDHYMEMDQRPEHIGAEDPDFQ
jgi:hypothetical protein